MSKKCTLHGTTVCSLIIHKVFGDYLHNQMFHPGVAENIAPPVRGPGSDVIVEEIPP